MPVPVSVSTAEPCRCRVHLSEPGEETCTSCGRYSAATLIAAALLWHAPHEDAILRAHRGEE